MTLCRLCLCTISDPGEMGICESCHRTLIEMPVSQRMKLCLQISELAESKKLAESVKGLCKQLDSLITISRKYSPYTMN